MAERPRSHRLLLWLTSLARKYHKLNQKYPQICCEKTRWIGNGLNGIQKNGKFFICLSDYGQ